MSNTFETNTDRTNLTSRWFSWIADLAKILAGIVLLALLHQPIRAFGEIPSCSYGVSLTWDASSSSEIIGYRIYFGTASGVYTNSLPMDNVMTVAIDGLTCGVTYFYAATSISADGQESGLSNEVSYRRELSAAQIQIHGLADGQFMLTVAGPVNHRYEIEATEDFSAWTVIGTQLIDVSGSFEFADTNAMNYPQRFYRTRDTQP